MTTICVASVKGAPGVTTLTCMLGAVWPGRRRAMVIEADPDGGDLAARFGLSSRVGWPSFNAAARRGAAELTFESHLQQLPGGLEVLVGTAGMNGLEAVASLEAFVSTIRAPHCSSRDVLIDLGRVHPSASGSMAWMDASDHVVICTRSDAASVCQVHQKSGALFERPKGTIHLVVVGKGEYSRHDVAEFTGIPVIGECALEPAAAAIACREQLGTRRLRRSSLLRCAVELASVLVDDDSRSDQFDPPPVTHDGLLARIKTRQKMVPPSRTSETAIRQERTLG